MVELLNSDPVKKQLEERKISVDGILRQLTQFKRGSINVELIRPATVNDGILKFTRGESEKYTGIYDSSLNKLNVVKFVPASGAASRMFKELISEYTGFTNEKSPDIKKYDYSRKLIENLSRFAFYSDLKSICSSQEFTEIIDKLLFPGGLNYTNLPKGLIKFHNYNAHSRTAFEEHLVEAKNYIKAKDNLCSIHFTVPENNQSMIEDYLLSVTDIYRDADTNFDLSYSVQNPSTDTIAVDMNNRPFIGNDGKLNFRPAGHGALIQNLNSIDADMIFIKNIDNVTVEDYLEDTVYYKKLLGGYLVYIKDKIQNFLKLLDTGNAGEDELREIVVFMKKYFFIDLNEDADLKTLLNRPLRVCGVVKNEGEPGGGPFWVKYGDLGESLQLVESAQVSMESAEQSEIWKSSTHFNPVDIVCWVKDYKGNKFDLHGYVDSDAGIITRKSADGQEIKALELPGLWNGAMAGWLTAFVEVSLITFNPVKTVFDLLRKEHQN